MRPVTELLRRNEQQAEKPATSSLQVAYLRCEAANRALDQLLGEELPAPEKLLLGAQIADLRAKAQLLGIIVA